jgi:hypothetical protein
MPHPDPIIVGLFATAEEAELAEHLLRARGLPAALRPPPSPPPGSPGHSRFVIEVPADAADSARRLLHDLLEARSTIPSGLRLPALACSAFVWACGLGAAGVLLMPRLPIALVAGLAALAGLGAYKLGRWKLTRPH